MIKKIFAFFWSVFLILILSLSVVGIGLFYNQLGLISLPAIQLPQVDLAEWLPDRSAEIKVRVSGDATPEINNLLAPAATFTPFFAPTELPIELPTSIPTVPPTPIPPLDPAVYRAEAGIRLKNYADVLQQWLTMNEQVSQNGNVFNDPQWQASMRALLQSAASSGQSLASVDPAPAEYQGIDAMFKRVGAETQSLQNNYLRALNGGTANDLKAAGDNFTRIKEYLTQAAAEMMSLGWQVN